ncbi:MAG: DUF2764 family protein [Chlamydiae bacterium]|nr:DUF2764 family protein [Chlamydiota bacterium]
MKKYYFVLCSLPELFIEGELPVSFDSFQGMLQINLKKNDLKQSILMRKYIDILNLRLFWQNKMIDPRGNLTARGLEEESLTGEFLPSFVVEFVNLYEELQDKLKHFPSLLSQFFLSVLSENKKGFLSDFFKMERETGLVLTAIRSKTLRRDIVKELQYEDPKDDFVAYILAQKDMEDFEPPMEYRSLKELYNKHYLDPKELNKAFAKYKFDKIDKMMKKKIFTIDEILGYQAKLMMVENFNKLDKNKGREIIDSIA